MIKVMAGKIATILRGGGSQGYGKRLVGEEYIETDWCVPGLRHVPEKEDKMRREDASVLALYQL